MKTTLYYVFCCTAFALLNVVKVSAGNTPTKGLLSERPFGFIENKGQITDQHMNPRPDILFGGHSKGLTFHLGKNGISYQLTRVDEYAEQVSGHKMQKNVSAIPLKTTVYRVDVEWLNTNKNVNVINDATLAGYDNFYLPGAPDGITEVKSFSGLTYKNIYEGIDLHYYGKEGILKYDLLVSPGADWERIAFKISGADKIKVQKNGTLILKTPLGNIEEGAPIVFQEGKRIPASWKIEGNILTFKITDYDKSLPLVIDPTTRLWATYYGGAGSDFTQGCTTDAGNNVYVCGSSAVNSSAAMATSGSHQTTFGGGSMDAFIVKFNSSGVRQWGTLYGGAGSESGGGLSVDPSGNLFFCGYTSAGSGTVMSTIGCHQPAYAGGQRDCFLAKFTNAGIRIWSTYYGGTGDDHTIACASDLSGNVYLAGYTDSNNGTSIATIGSHQPTNGGQADAFLVKFDGTGVRQWGTYYGGTMGDVFLYCVTDPSGNVYLTGNTQSSPGTVIATPGSHQPSYGGQGDGFLVKFDGSGLRQWGTYIGGFSWDAGYGIALDGTGNIFVSGEAISTASISTPGSHQPVHGGGAWDAFLMKFTNAGVRLWGTYYGGTGYDDNFTCATDPAGNVYFSGKTQSTAGTAIASAGSPQSTFGGNPSNYDTFLAAFSTTGVRLWGTYYGGTGSEWGVCTTDSQGNVFLAGDTEISTGTIIATPGSHQPAFAGVYDAYLVKFSTCVTPVNPSNTTPSANTQICEGNSSTLTAQGSGVLSWYTAPTGGSAIATGTAYLISSTVAPGSYTWHVEAADCAVSPGRTPVTITILPKPSLTVTAWSPVICAGQIATITAIGGDTYTWTTIGQIQNIMPSPTVTTIYTVTSAGSNGCLSTATVTQVVSECTGVGTEWNDATIIRIFPNPGKGLFQIEIKEAMVATIVNNLGQIIQQQNLETGLNEINIKGAAGIYQLKLGNSSTVKSFKLVKE